VAELVDPQTRELVLRVLADTGHAEFVIARVRAAIAADPHLGGRLALWARRLVGEALAQAYRVVADRRSLAALLAGASTAQAGTAQAGTAQAGTAQAGTAQAGTAQAGTAQAGTAQAGTAQAGTAQAGTAQAGTAQAGTAQAGTAQAGTAQAGTAPDGAALAGTGQAGTSPDGAANTIAAPPAQLGDIGRMLARITDAHAQRMAALGLSS